MAAAATTAAAPVKTSHGHLPVGRPCESSLDDGGQLEGAAANRDAVRPWYARINPANYSDQLYILDPCR